MLLYIAVCDTCLPNAVLSNAVCLHNAFFLLFFPLIYAKAF